MSLPYTNTLLDNSSTGIEFTTCSVIGATPCMSYYYKTGSTTGYLKFIQSVNPKGRYWRFSKNPFEDTTKGIVVDNTSSTNVGRMNNLIEVENNPALVYYDQSSNRILYKRALNKDGSQWPSSSTVVISSAIISASEQRIGIIKLSSNRLLISYINTTTNLITIAISTDFVGSGWLSYTLAPSGTANLLSLVRLVNNNPAIAYRSGTNLVYRYASIVQPVNATNWSAEVIVSVSSSPSSISLALVDVLPCIAYQSSTDLKYVAGSNANGTSWNTVQTIILSYPSGITSPAITSITFDHVNLKPVQTSGSDMPFIIAYDTSNKYLWYFRGITSITVPVWITDRLDTGKSSPYIQSGSFDVGIYAHMTILRSGSPAVAYIDTINNSTKFAFTNNEADATNGFIPWGFAYLDRPFDQIALDFSIGSSYSSFHLQCPILYTSIKLLLSSNRPCISYNYKKTTTNGILKYTRGDSNDGITWTNNINVVVDDHSSNDVGTGALMQIIDGNPLIVYHDNLVDGSSRLVCKRSIDELGNRWPDAVTVIDASAGTHGQNLNAPLGFKVFTISPGVTRLAIGYRKKSGSNYYVGYAISNDAFGSSWTSVNLTGQASMLIYNQHNVDVDIAYISSKPALIFPNTSQSWRYVRYTGADALGTDAASWGASGQIAISPNGNFTNVSGSLVALSDGRPYASFRHLSRLYGNTSTDATGTTWTGAYPLDNQQNIDYTGFEANCEVLNDGTSDVPYVLYLAEHQSYNRRHFLRIVKSKVAVPIPATITGLDDIDLVYELPNAPNTRNRGQFWAAIVSLTNGMKIISYPEDTFGGLSVMISKDYNCFDMQTDIITDDSAKTYQDSHMLDNSYYGINALAASNIQGFPAIAYCERTSNTTSKLKYWRSNNQFGKYWRTIESTIVDLVVDNTSMDTGLLCNILQVNDNPMIVYYNNADNKIQSLMASNSTGTTWTNAALTVAIDVPSLTTNKNINIRTLTDVTVAGRPCVTWDSTTTSYIRYALMNSAFTSWVASNVITSVSSATITGANHASLCMVSNIPSVAYVIQTSVVTTNNNLMYIRSNDITGTFSGIGIKVSSTTTIKSAISLEIINGFPVISYIDNNILYYVASTTTTGGSSSDWTPIVSVYSGANILTNVMLREIKHNSVLRPCITGYDSTAGNLVFFYYDGSSWVSGTDMIIIDGGKSSPYASINNVGALLYANTLLDKSVTYPCVAYYDLTNQTIKFAYSLFNKTSLASLTNSDRVWNISYADSPTDAYILDYVPLASRGYASINYWPQTNGKLGLGHYLYEISVCEVTSKTAIAYNYKPDKYSGCLKYIRTNDTLTHYKDWSDATAIVIDNHTGLNVGQYCKMFVTSSGHPAVVYIDQNTNKIYYKRARDVYGNRWPETLPTITGGTNGYFYEVESGTGVYLRNKIFCENTEVTDVQFGFTLLSNGAPAIAWCTNFSSVAYAYGNTSDPSSFTVVDYSNYPSTAPSNTRLGRRGGLDYCMNGCSLATMKYDTLAGFANPKPILLYSRINNNYRFIPYVDIDDVGSNQGGWTPNGYNTNNTSMPSGARHPRILGIPAGGGIDLPIIVYTTGTNYDFRYCTGRTNFTLITGTPLTGAHSAQLFTFNFTSYTIDSSNPLGNINPFNGFFGDVINVAGEIKAYYLYGSQSSKQYRPKFIGSNTTAIPTSASSWVDPGPTITDTAGNSGTQTSIMYTSFGSYIGSSIDTDDYGIRLNFSFDSGYTWDYKITSLEITASTVPAPTYYYNLLDTSTSNISYCVGTMANNNPIIGYYYATSSTTGYLKVLRSQNIYGKNWVYNYNSPEYITVDDSTSTNIGQHCNIAIIRGYPALVYYDSINSRILYRRASDTRGTVWTKSVSRIRSAVSLSSDLQKIGFVVLHNGQPAVSFYDKSAKKIYYYYSKSELEPGSIWSSAITLITFTSDDNNRAGYVSLNLINNHPAITYIDNNGDLWYTHSTDILGTIWIAPIQLTNTDLDSRIKYPVLLTTNYSNPTVVYYDVTNTMTPELSYAISEHPDGDHCWSRHMITNNYTDIGFIDAITIYELICCVIYDKVNKDLVYIHQVNNSSSRWDINIIDAGKSSPYDNPSYDSGEYCSLININNSFPGVCYVGSSLNASLGNSLKYAYTHRLDGAVWVYSYGNRDLSSNGRSIDYIPYDSSHTDTISYYGAQLSNISLNIVDNNPAMCYYYRRETSAGGVTGILKYMRCSDEQGLDWRDSIPVMIDDSTSNDLGQYNKLLIVNNNPAIIYADYTNNRVLYKRSLDNRGNIWDTNAVSVGSNLETSILGGKIGASTVNTGLNTRICASYINKSGSLSYSYSNDPFGCSFTTYEILTGTSNVPVYVSEGNSIALVISERPIIAYFTLTGAIYQLYIVKYTGVDTYGVSASSWSKVLVVTGLTDPLYLNMINRTGVESDTGLNIIYSTSSKLHHIISDNSGNTWTGDHIIDTANITGPYFSTIKLIDGIVGVILDTSSALRYTHTSTLTNPTSAGDWATSVILDSDGTSGPYCDMQVVDSDSIIACYSDVTYDGIHSVKYTGTGTSINTNTKTIENHTIYLYSSTTLVSTLEARLPYLYHEDHYNIQTIYYNIGVKYFDVTTALTDSTNVEYCYNDRQQTVISNITSPLLTDDSYILGINDGHDVTIIGRQVYAQFYVKYFKTGLVTLNIPITINFILPNATGTQLEVMRLDETTGIYSEVSGLYAIYNSTTGTYTLTLPSTSLYLLTTPFNGGGADPIIYPLYGTPYYLPNNDQTYELIVNTNKNIKIYGKTWYLDTRHFKDDTYSRSKIWLYEMTFFRYITFKINARTTVLDLENLVFYELDSLAKYSNNTLDKPDNLHDMKLTYSGPYIPNHGMYSCMKCRYYEKTEKTRAIDIMIDNIMLTITCDLTHVDERNSIKLVISDKHIRDHYYGCLIERPLSETRSVKIRDLI